jgi:hypothetical protein
LTVVSFLQEGGFLRGLPEVWESEVSALETMRACASGEFPPLIMRQLENP